MTDEPDVVEPTDAPANDAGDSVPEKAVEPASDTALADTVPPVEEKTYWPEDWRERWAGKDEKALQRLKRFSSPDNVYRSFMEADSKIRSGVFKQAALPEEPTEKEVAEYRKAHGIPEAPDGYMEHIQIPEGIELGDADKADLDFVLEKAHGAHLPPSAIKTVAEAFFARRMEAEQAAYEQAQEATINNRAALTAEFGREYKPTLRMVRDHVIKHAGEEGFKALNEAVLADGTRLGDNPAFIKMLASAAREVAGDGALVAAEYQTNGKSMDDRYQELLKLSTSSDPLDIKRYHSDEVQAELQKIVTARIAANRAA